MFARRGVDRVGRVESGAFRYTIRLETDRGMEGGRDDKNPRELGNEVSRVAAARCARKKLTRPSMELTQTCRRPEAPA